jgi:hypothetical protein
MDFQTKNLLIFENNFYTSHLNSLHLFIKNLLRDIVYAWFQANCSSTSGAYGLSDTIEKYDIDVLCLNETFEKDKNRLFY